MGFVKVLIALVVSGWLGSSSLFSLGGGENGWGWCFFGPPARLCCHGRGFASGIHLPRAFKRLGGGGGMKGKGGINRRRKEARRRRGQPGPKSPRAPLVARETAAPRGAPAVKLPGAVLSFSRGGEGGVLIGTARGASSATMTGEEPKPARGPGRVRLQTQHSASVGRAGLKVTERGGGRGSRSTPQKGRWGCVGRGGGGRVQIPPGRGHLIEGGGAGRPFQSSPQQRTARAHTDRTVSLTNLLLPLGWAGGRKAVWGGGRRRPLRLGITGHVQKTWLPA